MLAHSVKKRFSIAYTWGSHRVETANSCTKAIGTEVKRWKPVYEKRICRLLPPLRAERQPGSFVKHRCVSWGHPATPIHTYWPNIEKCCISLIPCVGSVLVLKSAQWWKHPLHLCDSSLFSCSASSKYLYIANTPACYRVILSISVY